MGLYDVDYPLPDLSDPPSDRKEMVRQIMEEGLFQPVDFTSWIWERTLLTGDPQWFLETSPLPDLPLSAILLVAESAVNAETDPEKALVLLWRYRGRKKETMRALEKIEKGFGPSTPLQEGKSRTSTEIVRLTRRCDDLMGWLDRALQALDAIHRAHTSGGCCDPACACCLEEDEDCDCGYCDASEDVAAYAGNVRETLLHERLQEPRKLTWVWTDGTCGSQADNGVRVKGKDTKGWSVLYGNCLIVAFATTRTAAKLCAEEMGFKEIWKKSRELEHNPLGDLCHGFGQDDEE
jgi:hypothetical protein